MQDWVEAKTAWPRFSLLTLVQKLAELKITIKTDNTVI